MLYLLLILDLKLLSFALAQLAYSLVLLVMYMYQFRQENLAKYFQVQPIVHKRRQVSVLQEHQRDLQEFTLVCLVKFVLTEGEKFIIFAFRDFVSTSTNNQ